MSVLAWSYLCTCEPFRHDLELRATLQWDETDATDKGTSNKEESDFLYDTGLGYLQYQRGFLYDTSLHPHPVGPYPTATDTILPSSVVVSCPQSV